jgi:hypothetical protein
MTLGLQRVFTENSGSRYFRAIGRRGVGIMLTTAQLVEDVLDLGRWVNIVSLPLR